MAELYFIFRQLMIEQLSIEPNITEFSTQHTLATMKKKSRNVCGVLGMQLVSDLNLLKKTRNIMLKFIHQNLLLDYLHSDKAVCVLHLCLHDVLTYYTS